ncbi:hypothetical protein FRC08_003436 [Ceratobasidium sp. 394]|nr:hypothetical protein FRC08_003436 [Ceratobasidium sp. 394]KAG9084896.1 hypothetical protein FS749_004878 [Ceratobasidium sp. UAMH 11750]
MTSRNSALISKSQRTFSTPELVTRILDFSATQSRARLLQTCKILYKAAIPYVWEHVDSAWYLLLLLDAAFEKPMWDARTTEPPEICLLDTHRRNNPFLRFEIYAPYVKSLDVYGRKRKLFDVSGWKVLISRAQQQVLLPNLHTLTIQTLCDSHGPDQLMWIETFASPALTNLLIVPSVPSEAPTISYAAASSIMKTLKPHLPRLQRLSLFPDYEVGGYADKGESNFLALLSGNPFHTYMADATSLRHLSGTLAWTDSESLLILAQLPHLETITIHSGVDEAGMNAGFKLPKNSFPSLRGLYLYNVPPFFVGPIMCLKPLLRGLTSLDLHINMDRLDSTEIDHHDWLNEDFFPCLASALHITELKIWAELGTENSDSPYVIDDTVLPMFSHLPLQSLLLRDMVLPSEALQLDLGTIWPSLTRLEIPGQRVSLASLPRFATLHRLQYLELELDLRNEPIPELHGLKQPALTTLVTSKGGKMCSRFADIDSVARSLLAILPGVTCVTWPEPKEGAPMEEIRQHEFAEYLNGHLSSLREIRALREAL